LPEVAQMTSAAPACAAASATFLVPKMLVLTVR
jgi:hypothetical protein